MKEAERAAIIATLGATQERLEIVAAEIRRIMVPHQVHRAELDGSAYFTVLEAAELHSLADTIGRTVSREVSITER